jgi:hypothetical protein
MHYTPTEKDKLEDLWRQLKEHDGTGSIVCPWCFTANKPGVAICCPDFKAGWEARGQHNLALVTKQIRELQLGKRRSFHCPYCDARLKKPSPEQHPADWPRPMVSPFCCDLLAEAVRAVAEGISFEVLMDRKKRIEDGLDRDRNGPVNAAANADVKAATRATVKAAVN